jgi:hypothetical protein
LIVLLKGHQGWVVVTAWSPDNRLLASGESRADPDEIGESQTVRLWDTATGKELASFGGFKVDVTALAFAPDGKSLGAGLRDGSILIWDVNKAVHKPAPTPKLGKQELESYWVDISGNDAAKAHLAIVLLTSSPNEAVPLLRSRLRPAPAADPAKIRQWIIDQDSTTLAVRQTGAKELEKAGGQAVTPIHNAIKANASLEARLRLEHILNEMDIPAPTTLSAVRGITVLERIGSLEAQTVLESLAKGGPGARETEEAKASLQRLQRRVSRD